MTPARLHGRNLTNVARIAGRADALKSSVLIDTRGVVTARTTLTKVNLDLAPRAHIVKRTIAQIVAGERETRGAVEARIRVAVVDGRLAQLAREARRTRAVDGAVDGRTTQPIVAAYGRVAKVHERVATSSRITLKHHHHHPIKHTQLKN